MTCAQQFVQKPLLDSHLPQAQCWKKTKTYPALQKPTVRREAGTRNTCQRAAPHTKGELCKGH